MSAKKNPFSASAEKVPFQGAKKSELLGNNLSSNEEEQGTTKGGKIMPTNVDKNSSTNVDKDGSTNVDKNKKFNPNPFGNNSFFDNKTKQGNKPSGPSSKVLSRIQKGKDKLRKKNDNINSDKNALSAKESKSFYASKHIKTMSEETSAQYTKRATLLVNRYKREQSIISDYDSYMPNPRDFVIWLLSLKPTVKSSTWRVYRQAAYHFIEGLPDDDTDSAIQLLDNDITESDARAGSKSNIVTRTSHKTSAMKEKKLPEEHFEKISAYLQFGSRSKLAPLLIEWMQATLLTGLRPIEWRATDIDTFVDDNGKKWTWLYVLNAKATNLRANGKVRTIDISDLDESNINLIRKMSSNGLRWYEDGVYDTMQSQVSQLLYTTNEKLFPNKAKTYALYSCRHQFIANMKSLMEPEEVSALSGHAVTKTAITSYGKKRSAWRPESLKKHVKPVEEEVSTVRKTASFYKERIEKLQKAGLIHGNSSPELPV